MRDEENQVTNTRKVHQRKVSDVNEVAAAAAARQAQVLIRPLEERKSQDDNELRNAFIKKYQFKISLNLQSRFEGFYERNKITKKIASVREGNKLINLT